VLLLVGLMRPSLQGCMSTCGAGSSTRSLQQLLWFVLLPRPRLLGLLLQLLLGHCGLQQLQQLPLPSTLLTLM
jgi:hypothetical protein